MESQFKNEHNAGLHLSLNGISLAGVVTCLPASQKENLGMTDKFSIDDINQIIKATGVNTRQVAPEGVSTGDLCTKAASDLIEALDWEPKSIDGLILITQTPNQLLPATACRIQNKLGLRTNSFAFDVNLGCSAYPYGLWLAGSLMASGANRILLLAGDTINKIVDPCDRSTAFLFGDAGTATALEKNGKASWEFILGTDGAGANYLQASSDECLKMDGPKVFEFTLQRIPVLLSELDQKIGQPHDYYLLHQANKFIIEHLRRKCKIPRESFPSNIDKFGNTSSASIPLLLTSELGYIDNKKGIRLALIGFGVGLSWGAASISLEDSSKLLTTFF